MELGKYTRVHQRPSRRAGMVLIAAWTSVAGVGCSSSGDSTPNDVTEARQRALAAIVDDAIVPTYAALRASTATLQTAVEAYRDALGTGTASSAAARTAFETAMLDLQRAELMQVGPAGAAGEVSGGEGLHDRLYSWPLVSPCLVDEVTVEQRYASGSFLTDELVNVYGADALEYLLYAPVDQNACASTHAINTDGTWAALSADEVRSRRAAYAAVVAAGLASTAAQLESRWTGGFAEQMKTAGAGSTVYTTTQQAFDELFAALYYFDQQLKDTKLGAPMGITIECAATSCPDLLESQHAHLSLEWVRANLEGYRLVLLGGVVDGSAGAGFDALASDAGNDELASRLRSTLADAISVGQTVQSPLADHLEDPEATGLHSAIQIAATLMKTSLVSTLNLSVPNEGAADND